MLGVLDNMGVEVQDREQVEVRENAQTCDDMWMNMFYADTSCGTLSHNVMRGQG